MKDADIIARFEREYLKYHRISADRCTQQLKLLMALADTLDKPLIEVDASDLQGFGGDLVAAGFHVNTVRKKLNMVRPFVRWGFAVGLIDADRFMKLKAVRNPRGSTANMQPKPYNRLEIPQLWRDLDAKLPKIPGKGRGSRALKRWLSGTGNWPSLRKHAMRLQIDAAIRLALDLGLRRHEIFQLSVDDLHYDNEYLVIRGKSDPNTGYEKTRTVPYTEHAREAVKDWLEFRALLRVGHDRPWISLWNTETYAKPMRERRFNTLLQDTVGKGWAWHRLRHTCATERLRSGMELETVSRLLGHATLQQTLAYAEIAKTDIQKALDKSDDAFGEAVGRVAA